MPDQPEILNADGSPVAINQGLPGGEPMPPPQNGVQETPDGVFVKVSYAENNTVKVDDVVTSGSTRPTEISDILAFGLRVHKQKNGIG